MASTFLNLSTDTTLGGNSPSDSVAVSQKAIKTYVDNNSGGGSSYTAGTGIDITNDVISVTSPTLTNTYNGTALSWYALNINGLTASAWAAIGIGANSRATEQGLALGYDAQATNNFAISIGHGSRAQSQYSIQLGTGTNSEANSFYVATSQSNNWKLLDSTGLIPSARIAIDGTSITVNSSGQLQASGGSDVEAFTAVEVQTIWESV